MNAKDAVTLIRCFGIRPVLKGLWHRVARHSGLLKRRFPLIRWDQLELWDFIDSNQGQTDWRQLLDSASFFPVRDVPEHRDTLLKLGVSTDEVIKTADQIAQGKFKFFSGTQVQFDLPVNWHLNPVSRTHWPVDVHWCDVNIFDKERGDIKLVWEISRFTWAYDLVRAQALSGDQKYAETFWELFEHWLINNQPNQSVNWASGQECALRLMAWTFALFAFLDLPVTTNERIEKFLLAAVVHCQRIEGFIAHAIRQKTNHAMTEATALYTIGTLFPFLDGARRWKNLGKKILESEGRRQIYQDGCYVQQSMNYHRLMLHTYLWSVRLGQLNDDEFSDTLKARLTKATQFLFQMQDANTGRVPNYGANDGALILPLNSCGYLDYRPIVQSCWQLLNHQRLYAAGPWDEDMVWLFGVDQLDSPISSNSRTSCQFPEGGYYTLRSKNSWAMIRCHTYRDRVGHVDPLHLDLWAHGVNLLRDCGSYKYFAQDEPELEQYFKSIWAHNTVVVDGRSPLRLVSRFIYLPWPRAEISNFNAGKDRIEWAGRHLAYDRSPWHVIHSRQVTVDHNQWWEIVDELTGSNQHKLELRWHLPDQAEIDRTDSCSVVICLPLGWSLKVTGPDRIDFDLLKSCPSGGWESLFYGHKQPISTLSVVVSCQLPCVFKTTLWREDIR